VASEGEVRTGVFVCGCGQEIAGVLDVDALVEETSRLPGVALARYENYGCSKAGLRDIGEAIREHGLNRVVVAGCTPRTHEGLFRKALGDDGADAPLLEMVNIREQCAAVHRDDPDAAKRKALDLIRMGVAKAALLKPEKGVEVEVTPAVLVIGGGIAGLTAALSVAKGGLPVKLVEKEEQLGGQVARLHTLYPTGESGREFIEARVRAVEAHPQVEVLTGSRVVDVSGSPGRYEIAVQQGGERIQFVVGAVVVAIGAEEKVPEPGSGYDGERVITQLELEQALEGGRVDACNVALILDGGGNSQYSAATAAAAVKNSILLSGADEERQVSVLFRDLSSDLARGQIEEARQHGVRFVRYDARRPPQITSDRVEVFDEMRNEEVSLPGDLVVLARPLAPRPDAAPLARLLRLPVDARGFLVEPNQRLRPGKYIPEGLFVCGSAHFPVDVRESVFQGYRAAGRALRYVSARRMVPVAPPARVVESLCIGCGTCVEACPFQAISMMEREGTLGLSKIDPVLCKGCGNCVVVCPAKAIVMEPYTDPQLIAQVEAALGANPDGEPRILGLFCEWSGYAAADLAGAEGRSYASNMRILRLGCSARFDPYLVLWAFLKGADGVLLGACEPGQCHYVEGNEWAEARVEQLRQLLKEAGFDPRRLRLEWFKPDDAEGFVEAVNAFTDDIEYLGPTNIA